MRILLSILIGLLVVPSATACKIPVFRYALEKWFADSYTMVVLHDGELTKEENKVLEMLRSDEVHRNTNLQVFVATKKEVAEVKPIQPLFAGETVKNGEAKMYLLKPVGAGKQSIITQSPLTIENARKVIYSEDRQAIMDEIFKGYSVVWLMVESGDKEADDAAYKQLQKGMKVVAAEIVIPDGVVKTDGTMIGENAIFDPENQLISDIPLKIDFTSLRISGSKGDQVLIKMLQSLYPTEPTDKPQVYSVFGRGRTLDPMVGEEINEENMGLIAEYLCGACSCQVKNQNPGADLLLFRDWDDAIRDLKKKPLQPSWVKK
jgi:hypothetical protein